MTKEEARLFDTLLANRRARNLSAAQGIEAGTGETRNAARPEGQEPGPEGMRPHAVGCVCKACTPEAAA